MGFSSIDIKSKVRQALLQQGLQEFQMAVGHCARAYLPRATAMRQQALRQELKIDASGPTSLRAI